jgi:uncharacterized membrane protein YkoI
LKRVLAAIAVAAGIGAGAAGVAAAASDSSSPSTSSSEADGQHQDPNYQSSVRAPEQDGQNEADEDSALQALATISPDQARQAALAAVPGTAGKVALENENGNVVYSVEITANGITTDVKIDAGNGDVLAKDTSDGEGGGESDGAAGATESGTDQPESAGK